MSLQLSYKQIATIGVVSYALQGVVLASVIYSSEKLGEKARYLASIVEKNQEHLDDFDLIALKDLGILKEP